jgi:hypothetical protein
LQADSAFAANEERDRVVTSERENRDLLNPFSFITKFLFAFWYNDASSVAEESTAKPNQGKPTTEKREPVHFLAFMNNQPASKR